MYEIKLYEEGNIKLSFKGNEKEVLNFWEENKKDLTDWIFDEMNEEISFISENVDAAKLTTEKDDWKKTLEKLTTQKDDWEQMIENTPKDLKELEWMFEALDHGWWTLRLEEI